jgi:REP element-mobilizing transposase RayT
MPRRPRIHIAGMPLHVVQRGHNREACFFTDEDYLAYREWLGEALKSTGCELHAYVQMTNHVHLLFTPPSPNAVPQLLISLGRRYVQYINKTYRRTGTLWDSRYKSSLVQTDTYLLQCQRYIELNPVQCAPAWLTIRSITDGAAIERMGWVNSTHFSHRTPSTAPSDAPTPNDFTHTALYSARNSTRTPSTTSASP